MEPRGTVLSQGGQREYAPTQTAKDSMKAPGRYLDSKYNLLLDMLSKQGGTIDDLFDRLWHVLSSSELAVPETQLIPDLPPTVAPIEGMTFTLMERIRENQQKLDALHKRLVI